MRPGDILRETARLVEGGREEAHGRSEVTHADIARLWNAYLETIHHADLTPGDVAQMMVLLKIARALNGQFNLDDFRDMAGYAALAGALMDPANRPDAEFAAETLPPLHLKADAAKIMGAVAGREGETTIGEPAPAPYPRGVAEALAGLSKHAADGAVRANAGQFDIVADPVLDPGLADVIAGARAELMKRPPGARGPFKVSLPGDKHCRAHSGDPVKRAVDDRLAKPAREDEEFTREDEEFRRAVRDFWRAYGVGGDQESSS
ncbi:MAG TPA: DUF6378 domain-containing protein [Hyphomicrobiales bacterium]|nr:DUF6378 domain-containing protein [Hyphomicrobiales bacterium]